MGFKSKLRSLLPPTSRFYEEQTDILETKINQLIEQNALLQEQVRQSQEKLEQLYTDFHGAVHNIHGNIEWGHARIADLSNKIEESDNHRNMQFLEIYKQPGETYDQTRRRFLQSLPQASGRLREIQNGNATLLLRLSEICKRNGLDIWLAGGTLIGAEVYQGFIPWDDDIDTYMEADELQKLLEVLNGNSDYRITSAYDPRAKCKQIRFCSTTPDDPYFVDIFPLYRSTLSPAVNKSVYQSARQALIDAYDAVIEEYDIDPFSLDWFYPQSDIGKILGELVEEQITSFTARLGQDRLTDTDKSATSYVRGIEHIDMLGNTEIQPSYTYDELFPLGTATFEGNSYAVANAVERMLTNEYGDYLKLPYDIIYHYHHID